MDIIEISEILECPICCSMLSHPVDLPCGHTFCHQCIKEAAKFRSVCPLCIREFTEAQIKPSSFLLKHFLSEVEEENAVSGDQVAGKEISAIIASINAISRKLARAHKQEDILKKNLSDRSTELKHLTSAIEHDAAVMRDIELNLTFYSSFVERMIAESTELFGKISSDTSDELYGKKKEPPTELIVASKHVEMTWRAGIAATHQRYSQMKAELDEKKAKQKELEKVVSKLTKAAKLSDGVLPKAVEEVEKVKSELKLSKLDIDVDKMLRDVSDVFKNLCKVNDEK
ncbi:E3 ubiquitin-protein ligase COP1 like protein [Aduncisulcus paluster]|uniref:E3 ubiquitin-protein ligase COP1 like protein n=1 Tax=Aduncisulcus paluster TaxID=2918883 RepID=A0ABQ5KH36_9EUKA|nr:E3 ubiquitin-protein ligase COP1 like protein [Aduncisulcus paluster]|eukprot:gnl/Carplike_NY0171/12012_a17243_123.p1 GENE.gnl/Carplike_NY0171/12012_a17243_123~~gnl/Carplike_NY0171/12012_a17243_123.p1  ORF type:complete len:286 (+),score=74.58 gnl/Carplike_NY0171/12012_a17243_123:12-869(+)